MNIITREWRRLVLKLCQQISYEKKGYFNTSSSTAYDIISKTQKYSAFIPWCSSSKITLQLNPYQNLTQLKISFNKLKQLSYLSHVKIQKINHPQTFYRIQSICKDQPLKMLISVWDVYQSKDSKTQVHYKVQYQFLSPILQMTSHFFLNYVGQAMWLVFKQQCQKNQLHIDNTKSTTLQHNTNKLQIKLQQPIRQVQIAQSIGQAHLTQSFKQNIQYTQQVDFLKSYLNKNKIIKQLYQNNSEFRIFVKSWLKKLQGTCNLQQKMQFHIKNYISSNQ